TPALNFNASQVGSQGAVYFHCNDGKLYALNATTGAALSGWPVTTGNTGGPPPYGVHLQTWSSSPVIAPDGRIYVGSANGRVYGFTLGGTKFLDVDLGRPIEASLAIGSDGWLYGATREATDYVTSFQVGKVFAINPGAYTVGNPAAAIMWSVANGSGPLSYLASPLIDQGGFVYFTDFGHKVRKHHPGTGTELKSWSMPGKLCQTPAINQYGHLFLGLSSAANDGVNHYGSFCAVDLADNSEAPYWESTTGGGQNYGDLLGAVLIRATSTGRVYFADTNGRLFFFDSNAPLMAGDWPTYQSGSRRTGVAGQYPFVIAELPGFYNGNNLVSGLGGLNSWGEAVGQSYGYYNYPSGSDLGYCAARWFNQNLTGYGLPYGIGNSHASGINDMGEAAGHWGSGALAWVDTASGPTYLSINSSSYPGFTLTSARATDINSAGTIIGYGNRTVAGVPRVEILRWTRGSSGWNSGDSRGAPAGDYAYPFAVADDGSIAGKAKFTSGGAFHAAVGTAFGGFTADLGTFGGVTSEAWDVNAESGVVGWAHNSSGRQRAFFIQNGLTSLQTWHELPRLPGTTSTTFNSNARGVNRFGQVAGRIQNDAGSYRAFRFTPGGGSEMGDLNSLTLQNNTTPAALGWNLTEAVSINDAGHLLGFGTKNSSIRGWIIYPQIVE
ncbi:MAG: hypothetical protein ACKO3N_17180, partial [Verrucomicrobiota bacterium]